MPPSSLPMLPPRPNPENFSLVPPPEEPPKPPPDVLPEDPKPKALVVDLWNFELCEALDAGIFGILWCAWWCPVCCCCCCWPCDCWETVAGVACGGSGTEWVAECWDCAEIPPPCCTVENLTNYNFFTDVLILLYTKYILFETLWCIKGCAKKL